jgi:predicted Ser/Thr protein kinase
MALPDSVQYIDDHFPDYTIIKTLSRHFTSCVYLAEKDEKLYVIKEQPGEYCFLEDPGILMKLSHKGLPAVTDVIKADGRFYYIYEYIPGETLTEAYESGRIGKFQAIDITVKLCDIIAYLQTFQMIHSDIKPDNVIIFGNDVYLIDFGIARIYDKKNNDETRLIGTKGFVSPELGYKKTDFRADVYALGMVLYWMLTGSEDIKLLNRNVPDKSLARIVRRATDYDVNRRYKNAGRFAAALNDYKKGRSNILPMIGAAVAACLLCFAAGAVAGTHIIDAFEGQSAQNTVYTFADPVVERAIRLNIGKTDGEPVYGYDLLTVNAVYITQDRVFETSDEFYAFQSNIWTGGVTPQYGYISSLDDIKACTNLRDFCVTFNAIDDLSALNELTKIQNISVTETNVSDISAVRHMPKLSVFHADRCTIPDLSPLKACGNLEYISLSEVITDSFDIFNPGGFYTDIHLSSNDCAAFAPFLENVTVRRLTARDCGITDISVFPDMTVTELLDLSGNPIRSAAGIERIIDAETKVIVD